MIELYEAVKNLLAQKETYFDRHPEAVPVVESIEDPEYDAAWDRLENAFKNMAVGEIKYSLIDPKMVVDGEYKGTLVDRDKLWKPVGGIVSHS